MKLKEPLFRVSWDLPTGTTAQPPSTHPLHNVTLVTTPSHSQDDLSDVLEEVLDLWTALHKSSRDYGHTTRCHSDLNEE